MRRTLSITLYVAAFTVMSALAVPLLLLAVVVDAFRGRRWTVARALVFLLWYLACEMAGILASFLLWLGSGVWAGANAQRFVNWNYALQHWWARMLGRGAFRIFDIRLDVRAHRYPFGTKPLLVFVRHASTADTILAALLLSVPYGTRLRYVLKRELLWDPCLDIVGNRIPNVFVDRDASDGAREIAAVAALARDLGPNDGVLIYPEGTRFSPARKARAVAKLRDKGLHHAARDAEQLRHVMPLRPGGALALLEAAPDADVVFVAHTGFEGSASFDRFFNGGLIGKTVHVQLDVIPGAEVPSDEAARRDWLMERWRRIDRFIAEQHDGASEALGA